MSMNKVVRILFWLSLLSSIFFASWFALHNTLYFHTDIARDFLLMEDIVVNHKPALIGPRSGGIPGVFHGPAWIYLNLPIFFMSGGNPVATAWFWVFLIVVSVVIVFYTAKRFTNTTVAMGSAAIYALTIAEAAPNLFNPFGAVMLSSVFLFFFMRYIQKQETKDLLILLFTLGMIIQFQMAWGVPILILSTLPILYFIFKKKKIFQITSFGILAIPLSSYFLFDLRHQFLQIRAVLSYIMGSSPDKPKTRLLELLVARGKGMILSLPEFFSHYSLIVSIMLLSFFLFALILFFFKKSKKKPQVVFWFLYFYIGFWIITLLFKGTMWSYYYWPFLPLISIVVGILIGELSKKYSAVIFAIILLLLIGSNIQTISKQDKKFFKQNTGLWNYYFGQAAAVYQNAEEDFGWFVYTADQYGYSTKYAMSYAQQLYPNKGYKFQKLPLTYLIIYPSTNKYTNEQWWKKNQIKINRISTATSKSLGGSYIEKYYLTTDEATISADPTLIQDLIFR